MGQLGWDIAWIDPVLSAILRDRNVFRQAVYKMIYTDQNDMKIMHVLNHIGAISVGYSMWR